MKTKIIADSSCDILEIPGIDFSAIPLTISTDERTFIDDSEIDVPAMLDYLASYKGRSYTACPNIDAWIEMYGDADVIYVVTLSSALSGTYSSAVNAASIYKETHPNVKIHIFDTLSAGPEVRMLVDKIAECMRSQMSFENVCETAKAYIKQTRIFFALESFHNFAQNGRVNKTVALLGGLLGIKIMATGSPQGKIKIVQKYRGQQKTFEGFFEQLSDAGYSGGKVCIAHCDNETFAITLVEEIQRKYPGVLVEAYPTRGLCSYYAERGGILLGFECK